MSRSQVRQVEFSPARLRAFRGKIQMTQEDLAREIGVTLRSVTRWENGIGQPTADKVFALAQALGCDADDLYIWKAAA